MNAHFWLFHSGNPTQPPSFTLQGHLVLDLTTKISTGNIVARANDGSWVVHASFTDFVFDNDLFSTTINFTTISGNPPTEFVGTSVVGPVPQGVLIPTGAPNVDFFVGSTPPAP